MISSKYDKNSLQVIHLNKQQYKETIITVPSKMQTIDIIHNKKKLLQSKARQTHVNKKKIFNKYS